MSNYTLKAKNKNAEEVFTVHAIDDYFGSHKYGYEIDSVIYNQSEFDNKFDVVPRMTTDDMIDMYLDELQTSVHIDGNFDLEEAKLRLVNLIDCIYERKRTR